MLVNSKVVKFLKPIGQLSQTNPSGALEELQHELTSKAPKKSVKVAKFLKPVKKLLKTNPSGALDELQSELTSKTPKNSEIEETLLFLVAHVIGASKFKEHQYKTFLLVKMIYLRSFDLDIKNLSKAIAGLIPDKYGVDSKVDYELADAEAPSDIGADPGLRISVDSVPESTSSAVSSDTFSPSSRAAMQKHHQNGLAIASSGSRAARLDEMNSTPRSPNIVVDWQFARRKLS